MSISRDFACFNISRRDVRVSEVLSDGGYGVVYHGKLKRASEWIDVAIKEMCVDGRQGAMFENECVILQMLTECGVPGVVGYYGKYYDATNGEETGNLVMEYAPMGDMCAYMLNNIEYRPPRYERNIYEMVGSILPGLERMHAVDLWHCDIKPENILINSSYLGVLTDFGMATYPENVGSSPRGTPGYTCPEVVSQGEKMWSAKSDIYSLGLTLYAAASQTCPHPEAVIDGELLKHKGKLSKLFANEGTKKIAALCYWSTLRDPEKRPTISELCVEFKTDIEEISPLLRQNGGL